MLSGQLLLAPLAIGPAVTVAHHDATDQEGGMLTSGMMASGGGTISKDPSRCLLSGNSRQDKGKARKEQGKEKDDKETRSTRQVQTVPRFGDISAMFRPSWHEITRLTGLARLMLLLFGMLVGGLLGWTAGTFWSPRASGSHQ